MGVSIKGLFGFQLIEVVAALPTTAPIVVSARVDERIM
jgi:hypothetical protein